MEFENSSFMNRKLIWEPSDSLIADANLTKYMKWLSSNYDKTFNDFESLREWSVTDLDGFWTSIWKYFHVTSYGRFDKAIEDYVMPGARWFEGSFVSYPHDILRCRDDSLAIIAKTENGEVEHITYKQLYSYVSKVVTGLRAIGVKKGDTVVAILPNIIESVVSFLAVASIGAIWSSCSPEFGQTAVVERFKQIRPKVILGVAGYNYGGKYFNRLKNLQEISSEIDSLENIVIIGSEKKEKFVNAKNYIFWEEFLGDETEIEFEFVDFNHPLWVLYSSGTTGLPKSIVQSHGGILLEHYKVLSLHLDLKPNDRFFWYTSTGWMMWNFLIGGLLIGCTIVLYDGSPAYPNLLSLWELSENLEVTYFGISASFIQSCINEKIHPGEKFDLSKIKSIGSTGSPLSVDCFDWISTEIGEHVLINSCSGGTDLCTAFIGSTPTIPLYLGTLQSRSLGADIESFDEKGVSRKNFMGEMVIKKPMPSMPLYFWGDKNFERYKDSYFGVFPNVWRHGDWLRINNDGSCVIFGRSDATLNRGGVRMGTSEFYQVVNRFEQITDSLIIDTGNFQDSGKLILFVVLSDGFFLDKELTESIKRELRNNLSPRHSPDIIYSVPEIPMTLSGKKMEVAIKSIFSGKNIDTSISKDSMKNPNSLIFFHDLYERLSNI